MDKKVTQKVIFHPFAQKSPVNGFLPNLEQTFHWSTESIPTNYVSICSRVSILQGFKVSIFPIGNWRRRYNSAALPRSLWNMSIIMTKITETVDPFYVVVSRAYC